MDKARHAFGTLENVDAALAANKIDAYDILFVKDAKGKPFVGWIDKDGNKVIVDDTAELAALEASIAKKANVEEVESKIATKADSSEVEALETKMETKANISAVEALGVEIATKANADDVETLKTQMESKVDTTTVETMIETAVENATVVEVIEF